VLAVYPLWRERMPDTMPVCVVVCVSVLGQRCYGLPPREVRTTRNIHPQIALPAFTAHVHKAKSDGCV
jgi:hypothetical protein